MSTKFSLPQGFKFYGGNVGIKQDKMDFAVAYTEMVCSTAGVFTQNSLCGVSIPIDREIVSKGKLQSIVVTSGVANVATGNEGIKNVNLLLDAVSKKLDIKKEFILPSATGVIGRQLPINQIIDKLSHIDLKHESAADNIENFATAIMTTDKEMKICSAKIENATIVGVCKGVGMIEPNMATMLAYIFTDANIDPASLNSMLRNAVNKSFNMISIDTDMSTSDSVVIMANGLAGNVDHKKFEEVLAYLCVDMAKKIVIDGEGATKLIEVNVESGRDFDQAKKIAKSIVNSPLIKTAVYGADPNWGRVMMAIGKVMDNSTTYENISISFGEFLIYDKGEIFNEKLDEIKKYLQDCSVCKINVNLNLGKARATVWGCDLTEEYININGSYTS